MTSHVNLRRSLGTPIAWPAAPPLGPIGPLGPSLYLERVRPQTVRGTDGCRPPPLELADGADGRANADHGPNGLARCIRGR